MKSKTATSPESLVFFHIPSDRQVIHPIAAITLAILLPLAGCGVGTTITSGAVPADAAITGRVHGGQQAVVGANVTLYAPGTGGYGTAPTVIATTTTPTDSSGSFTLPGPYPRTNCPANSPITYIVATGGNSGAGDNPSIALAALLPACSTLTASTFVWISEVTTVAAAYALAPFADLTTGATNIGTSSTPLGLLGLANALGPANNLADIATGNAKAATSIPGLILPTNEINTLADILAACVNSTPITRITSTTCTTLFTEATPPATGTGGGAPTNTFQAAIDIALNPGNNAAALYALATPVAPFQPTLPSAPSDFAVGIRYNGNSIILGSNGSGISGIDIDASGNAWVIVDGTASLSNITEISPAGVFLSGDTGYLSGGLNFPTGIAIDNSDNAWVVNYQATTNVLVKVPLLNPGAATLFTPTSLAGSTGPVGIAVDNIAATIWTANWGGTTVSEITTAGVDANPAYGSQDTPWSVAIASSGNIWVVSNIADGFLTEFTPNAPGAAYTQHPIILTGSGTTPESVAIDNSGDLWVTELHGLAKYSNAGALISPVGGYGQNPYNGPAAVTIDGLGRAWVSNAPTDTSGNYLPSFPPGSVTAFKPDGTLISTSTTDHTPDGGGPFLGYTAAGAMIEAPTTSIKIDPSGNLWITGAAPSGGPEFVTELIGIAAPVVTPLSVAVSTKTLGTRP